MTKVFIELALLLNMFHYPGWQQNFPYKVNSWLSGIQVQRILNQPATISKKRYHF
jgi:hypothetical protein